MKMNVVKEQRGFAKASEIQIPEVFFRRFKTGVQDLDTALGGEGFLPGQTFTIAGQPGAGKTTLLLQTLELLESAGKKTAYVSGEESIYQVAFASRRLNVKNVSIANMTVIEDIFDAVKEHHFEMIVLDSFPSLETREGLEGKRKEEYLSNYITAKAKELEVVVGVVLHITKTGTYKGSTLLPHSVDANIMLRVSEEDESLRELEITKNRFGRTGITSFPMTEMGFNFESVQPNEDESGEVSSRKRTKNQEAVDNILEEVRKMGQITSPVVARILGDVSKVQKIMKEMVNGGLLEREGRGVTTVWKMI